MHVSDEVRSALRSRAPVVALESTVITHGLPVPVNLETARRLEAAVREEGAVPATIGILEGEVRVGLGADELEALATRNAVEKASLWNLAAVVARRRWAGTTVATTAHLAARAGIRVFATGGIGGVHPVPFDESSDLMGLSRTPVAVVSSGPKSILDLGATLERLESYGVGVVGYKTKHLPAFHSPDSPFELPATVWSEAEAAAAWRAARALGLESATLVFNPVSEGIPYRQVMAWVDQANEEARAAGIGGKDLTPYLLRRLGELSRGRTDEVNLRLLEENARLAARIARQLTDPA
ncbi:Indigoidine synthase A family protein [Oceanithermus profundus DSM 14977]|uniref:Pseudouridine-5'-phosphate glycosidase n=1 Tax=Oceanithermus profundus (strain DSM 14977 / NBRC 100410 / VKM B-2274 / 506) TaxID=670487 RepID=E4U520_OCEP5|nr:pseudouridine-5'-phosphate glycosidase [Oceanithermus profundus]ADR37370.1 Indigoidine synthase A family protein [Oceanithermus profundus DSM 14977]